MEDVLDGIKAYFETNLDTELSSIESTRECEIERWKVIDTAPTLGNQTPIIEILPDATVPSYLNEDAPNLEGWEEHFIHVLVSMSGTVPKDVQYGLLRYAEAIIAITDDDFTYGDRFNRVLIANIDYSLMIEAATENTSFLQVLDITLAVRETLNT